MTRKVLSVGQCRPDHAAISHFLTSNFDAQVIAADLPGEAHKVLSSQDIALVLINRNLDADYSDGMEILRTIKANEATADIPVMLVSNFADWQEKAVHEGAIYGFGKAQLGSPETVDRVRSALNIP